MEKTASTENYGPLNYKRLEEMRDFDIIRCAFEVKPWEIKALIAEVAARRSIDPTIAYVNDLLKVTVEQSVWPKEVEMLMTHVGDTSQLPEEHVRRIRLHISRLWLERVAPQQIIISGTLLVNNFTDYFARLKAQEAAA